MNVHSASSDKVQSLIAFADSQEVDVVWVSETWLPPGVDLPMFWEDREKGEWEWFGQGRTVCRPASRGARLVPQRDEAAFAGC